MAWDIWETGCTFESPPWFSLWLWRSAMRLITFFGQEVEAFAVSWRRDTH